MVLQAAFLAGIAAILWYLWSNLATNTRALNVDLGFDYLDQPAGFAIPNTDFSSGANFLVALWYGFINTIIVSFAGIVLATIIGIVVGVARLSTNWLVRKAAAVYVETLRNIPVLLIIVFWWLAIFLELPGEEPLQVGGSAFLSNKGLVFPKADPTADAGVFAAFVALGLVAAAAVAWWRTRVFDRTGQPHHRVLWSLGVLTVATAVGWVVAGTPFVLDRPELGRFGAVGGTNLSIEFAALLVGLTIYTASHIAEIVRGSILAVPRGQTEAATALGLSGFQRMRYVILPQAFRIMVPPLANQYLNLTKNSSLGVAVGYYELMKVTLVSISQGGPAPQAIAIVMGIYLGLSLAISAVANVVNRRLLAAGARS